MDYLVRDLIGLIFRENGKLSVAEWDEALSLAAEKLSGDPRKIAAIVGDLCDAESMKALKDLMSQFRCEKYRLQTGWNDYRF